MRLTCRILHSQPLASKWPNIAHPGRVSPEESCEEVCIDHVPCAQVLDPFVDEIDPAARRLRQMCLQCPSLGKVMQPTPEVVTAHEDRAQQVLQLQFLGQPDFLPHPYGPNRRRVGLRGRDDVLAPAPPCPPQPPTKPQAPPTPPGAHSAPHARPVAQAHAGVELALVLGHLLHRNHSPEFWETLAMTLPDWAERKAMLEAWELEPRAV
ncbi:MAG: M48 family metallopeptidase [Polyangiaceae bacterium]|nr:M48 family metallopeptidase [Polyangiaceae bacterium]